MGIRVDKKSLLSQLKKSDCLDRLELPYHQKNSKCELPYTIGGEIGQSYEWYLKLRKYGTCEKSGFGIGFERLLMFITGMDSIKDVNHIQDLIKVVIIKE